MKAIVYESNSGFTQKYAKMLSEKTGLSYYSTKEAKKQLKKGDEVFFMGWIFGSKIMGFKKANKKYKLLGCAAVGISEASNKYKNELIKNNKIETINFFYLRGGFDLSKLKGAKANLVKVLIKTLERDTQVKGCKKEDRELLRIFKNGANFVDERNLAPILKFVNN